MWCFFFVVCTPCYRAPALRAALFDCCCVCYEASGRIFTFSRSTPPKSDRGGGSKIGLLVYIVLGWLALSRTSRRCHLFSADVCVVHVSFVVRLSLFRCAMESFARSPIGKEFFRWVKRLEENTITFNWTEERKKELMTWAKTFKMDVTTLEKALSRRKWRKNGLK